MITFLLIAMLNPAPEAEPVGYAAGERVPIEFSLRERDREGGRTTPFFTHYRASISSDRRSRELCVFHVPGGGGVTPGETRQIEMVCPFPTQAGVTFEFYEVGRPIGRATVLAPKTAI